MGKWIYLDSDNWADALALATVLKNADENYNIVRQSFNSSVFQGLNNVSVGFYRDGEELIKIDSIRASSWQQKCIEISKILDIPEEEKFNPYLDFVKQKSSLVNLVNKINKFSLLYLFPNPNSGLDLNLIDSLIRILEQQQMNFISGGSNIIPCIHGTKDCREIFEIGMIGKLKSHIDFILTTENVMTTLGDAFGINVFVLSFNEGVTINGFPVYDSSQLANYIWSNL